jgi:hypothetical protein
MKNIFSNINKEPSAKILKQLMQEVAEDAKSKAQITNQKLVLSVKDEIKRLQLKYKF